MLKDDVHVRNSVRHHDRSVLVDEAQDCDLGQLAFVEQLVGPPPGDRHLFVVMDPNQSLYAFRHAKADAVRAWMQRYAGSEAEISENYRCLPRIQQLAGFVIQQPSPIASGGSATLAVFSDRTEEADFLTQNIRNRIADGLSPQRIAVLARRRTRLSEVESALSAHLEIRSSIREQWSPNEERILDAVAFIKDWREGNTRSNPNLDFLVSLTGLSFDAVQELEHRSTLEGKHPGDLLSNSWWLDLVQWLESRRSPEEIVEHIAQTVKEDVNELEGLLTLARRASNLTQLIRTARAGPATESKAGSAILVSTFHGAKGLEFDVVYVVGCEDGTIPDFRTKTEDELREERRGLYVAITRAKESVVLTYVQNDNGFQKRLSRFLPPRESALWDRLSSQKLEPPSA